MTITETAPTPHLPPSTPKGQFPSWFNADTLPDGIEHRIRGAQLRLWLLLPEFLDATIQAWEVWDEWESLDLPDDQRAIARRLGFDTLSDTLSDCLPELLSEDPRERFRAQSQTRATAEEARSQAADTDPDWLRELAPAAETFKRPDWTVERSGGEDETAAVPSWINLDEVVPAELVAEAKALTAQIQAEAAPLLSAAERAKVVLAEIDTRITGATNGEGMELEALWDFAGQDALFNALRGVANAVDPDGPR